MRSDNSFGGFVSAGDLGGNGSAPSTGRPSGGPSSIPPTYPSNPSMRTPPASYPDPRRTAPSTPPPPPVRTAPAAAPKTAPSNRISAGRELCLLIRQGILVLFGEKRNLIISLFFPVIAAAITIWIAGENMFVHAESTKSACFILVCAAIWGGLFNSIQTLVKERDNIKRDYVSGALRIGCYMTSRALIQFVLCAIQSAVLTLSIPGVKMLYDNPLPSEGLLGLPVIAEFYIALFLIMYASDALGLMISSFVKKEELASKLAPYILIAQLLFSGVLFKLEGAANYFSGIMISRWGMEALGSICNLNNANTTVFNAYTGAGYNPDTCSVLRGLQHMAESKSFTHTSNHMITVVLIMVAFIVVPLILGGLLLRRVKKDGRD